MPTILAERPLLAPIAESSDLAGHPKKKRGPKPKVIVEFPEASGEEWVDPPSFPEALALHMRRHGDSCNHLHRAIIGPDDKTDRKTIQTWATGVKAPGTIESLSVLSRIERRYRLPEGYFQAKLDRTGRATARPAIAALKASERRKLAWHLPGDFSKRPKREREEILAWVRSVIIEGATEYRRFQREATQQRFSLRFSNTASGETRLAQVEFALIPFLGYTNEHHARTLYRIVMSQPGTFVELLCLLYKPRHRDKAEEDEKDETAKANAETVWRVLHACEYVPGTQADGLFREQRQHVRQVANHRTRGGRPGPSRGPGSALLLCL